MAKLTIAIQHRKGDFVLNVDLSLSITGITLLLGRSGSGKSTLLRCIAGLEKPNQALIRFNKTAWQNTKNNIFLPAEMRHIGVVFQQKNLFPHLNVEKNILFGYKRTPHHEKIFNVAHVIKMLDIKRLLSRNVQALSEGEQQRVAIARALLNNPKMILLDEPINSLDDESKSDILSYLVRIRDNLKIPMLYITHSKDECEKIAGPIIQIQAGQVSTELNYHSTGE